MKKLIKMFKSLPPEIRTLLALAGLASPIGAIYFIKRFFPGVSTLTIIFCIIGIALVLGLLALIQGTIVGIHVAVGLDRKRPGISRPTYLYS